MQILQIEFNLLKTVNSYILIFTEKGNKKSPIGQTEKYGKKEITLDRLHLSPASAKGFFCDILKKRKEKLLLEKRKAERNRLREDIEKLEEEIKRTEAVFNLTTDEYLLESVIYEQNAQKAKMNYLLKLAKELAQ